MATNREDDDQAQRTDDIAARVEKLKQEAASLADGPMRTYMAPDCPLEVQERFWTQVIAFERKHKPGKSKR